MWVQFTLCLLKGWNVVAQIFTWVPQRKESAGYCFRQLSTRERWRPVETAILTHPFLWLPALGTVGNNSISKTRAVIWAGKEVLALYLSWTLSLQASNFFKETLNYVKGPHFDWWIRCSDLSFKCLWKNSFLNYRSP